MPADLGPAELRQMQHLAQQVTALRPDLLNGDATIGELAWVWAKDVDALGHSWRHRFWHTNGQLTAWGWAWLPHDGTTTANLLWQTHPDHPELLPEILDWYDATAGDVVRHLTIQQADTHAQNHVAAHGYTLDEDDKSWVQWNTRDLTDVPQPVLPENYRFRTAADVPITDAVQAHMNAWPKSRLTDKAFAKVQETWPYRPDLHVLIEAPDGTLAASAITWFDETTRTAEFEPVGTHQNFRRKGLGTALQLYGMQLAKNAGATRMFVACAGEPTNTAARAMYYGVGFRPITRDLPQIKNAAAPTGR
ncbi:N-acetyltransferase [Kutzneria buriramensis]|uniref:Ribosomal protein S18 acetylase RimI-like enzyme n=1 Tax=Kutzneria buriramensis TaxID=1045776 RepID=A0A3E0H6X6_9PSEU|nr:GNAT family N-acetyltransferase [Kutzneria buriramensis]REH39212.1 ribosomal protein S18 acetylase RimI-like enzyme [Kutzneria buriramensis]